VILQSKKMAYLRSPSITFVLLQVLLCSKN